MNKTVKIILGIVALIIIILLASRLNNKPTDDRVLVVGAILPLSGPLAQFGEIYKSGLDLGFKDYPEIKVIYEDSKGDPNTATAAFQKLRTVNNADIVVSIISKASMPLAPLAQQNKMPLIASVVAAKNMTSIENDYVYRLFWTSDELSETFLNRVATKDIKHIAILQEKTEVAQSIVDAVVPTLEKNGIKVTLESFNDTETDFKTQLNKIKLQKPEALTVITVAGGNWKNILTQANQLDINVPVYDVLGVFMNPGTPETLGDLAEGVYTVTTPFATGQYKKEFKEQLGDINSNGYFSYGLDTAMLVSDLYKNNKTNSSDIYNYLKNLKTFEGVTSPYSIDDAHNIKGQAIKAQFINGKLVVSEY